jgi:hypothetical protein
VAWNCRADKSVNLIDIAPQVVGGPSAGAIWIDPQ